MFELVAMILLAIFTVMMAGFGVGKMVRKGPEELVNYVAEKAGEKIGNYVGKGVRKLDDNELYSRGVATADFLKNAYREVRSGKTPIEKAYGLIDAAGSALHTYQYPTSRLGGLGRIAHYITYGKPHKQVSQADSKAILDTFGIKVPSLREVDELRDGAGNRARAVTYLNNQGKILGMDIDSGLSWAEKIYATLHEVVHSQNPKKSEGEVEKIVGDYLYGMVAARQQYHEQMAQNRPDIYEEFKKHLAAS